MDLLSIYLALHYHDTGLICLVDLLYCKDHFDIKDLVSYTFNEGAPRY